jgi:hypothetical protein
MELTQQHSSQKFATPNSTRHTVPVLATEVCYSLL